MISPGSLADFAAAVSPVRGPAPPAQPIRAVSVAAPAASPSPVRLPSGNPSVPDRRLPRGSLVDLRV